MYILIITLYSIIGVDPHPVVLKGDPPTPYRSYEECVKAGVQVKEWLTQDFINVQFTCEDYHETRSEIHHDTAHDGYPSQ